MPIEQTDCNTDLSEIITITVEPLVLYLNNERIEEAYLSPPGINDISGDDLQQNFNNLYYFDEF